MVKGLFECLLESATELNLDQDSISLSQMKDIYEENIYFVAFIGQFSSGKSSLINNLVGKNILPTGRLETTPLLTYIRYGKEERGVFHYIDGTEKIVSIDDIVAIKQNNIQEFKFETIKYLEVFVDSELLSSGLILLDTPGVNTLIAKHEELLAESLLLASRIVYVVEKQPTESDIEKIKDMIDAGFNISLVRTHCDEINKTEESIDYVFEDDIKICKGLGIPAEQCFHISNIKASYLHENISEIEKMLLCIGSNLKSIRENDILKRLNVYTLRYLTSLEEKYIQLEEKKNNDFEAIENRKQKYLSQIEALNASIERQTVKVRKELNSGQTELISSITSEKDRLLFKSKNEIIAANIDNAEDMQVYIDKQKKAVLQSLMKLVVIYAEPLFKKLREEINVNSLEFGLDEISEEYNLPQLMNFEDQRIDEIQGQLEKLYLLKDTITSMDANDSRYLALKEDIDILLVELRALNNEMSELGTYVPEMIEKSYDGLKPSDVGKIVGEIADWAMIFLPNGQATVATKTATAAAKATQSVGVAAKVVGKTGSALKYGRTASKVLTTITKAGKVAAETIGKAAQASGKFVKTTGEYIKTGARYLRDAREVAPPEIYEYLTLEYWGKEIGKNFDPVPVYYEDPERKRLYELESARIKSQILEKQQIYFEKMVEMGLLENAVERRQAQERSLKVQEKDIILELEKRKEKIERDVKEETLRKWKNSCAEKFIENMNNGIDAFIKGFVETIPIKGEQYIETKLVAQIEALEQAQEAYNEIVDMDTSELDVTIERISNLLDRLKTHLNKI